MDGFQLEPCNIQRTILLQLIHIHTWLNKRVLDKSSNLIFSKTKHLMKKFHKNSTLLTYFRR